MKLDLHRLPRLSRQQQQQQQLTAFDVTMAVQDSVAGQSGRVLHKPFSAQGLQLVLAPAVVATCTETLSQHRHVKYTARKGNHRNAKVKGHT